MTSTTPLTPRQLDALRPSRNRFTTVTIALTATLVAGVATVVLMGLEKAPAHTSAWPSWDGHYSQIVPFLGWLLGDTTEPGYAHSAIGGVLMVVGGCIAHTGFRRGRCWSGFPVTSGTGLFPWAVGSAALGLLLSNLAWGWTIAATDHWQPTFVPFASVPAAVVLIYGGRLRVAVTGAVLGAALTTPAAVVAVNVVCRPLELPNVLGATTGMWSSALLAFLICRHLPWIPPPCVWVPRCHVGLSHCFTDTTRQGALWVVRRMFADFTEAQFIGSEWASAGLLVGTVGSYLFDPVTASGSGHLLPRVMIGQILSAAIATTVWQHQWVKYGWYPTFIPVVSITPAAILAFGGSAQSILAGAVLGAFVGPPVAACISRRLPSDFHPFIGNAMSMTVTTTAIVGGLSVLPGFG